MPGNSFGQIFKFSTWGESHGPAIGCTVDGVPSKIKIHEKDIQFYLDKRRPGSSKFVSQRKEKDKIKILSGVFENQTTGAPISFIIENKDQKSGDYKKLKNIFRPGHADFTYEKNMGYVIIEAEVDLLLERLLCVLPQELLLEKFYHLISEKIFT